ncbi:hypothetical protein DVH05_019371 [Phytophthora capsici]|nr:hypothetical protein DVH05_019371 [Phytophthora capsici]
MEVIEQLEQAARIQRAEDTRKRNAAAQNRLESAKKARRGVNSDRLQANVDADAKVTRALHFCARSILRECRRPATADMRELRGAIQVNTDG